ncbi:hypothetical protein ACP70R_006375 [Stipagrostis hirtigluma subsp. patula]
MSVIFLPAARWAGPFLRGSNFGPIGSGETSAVGVAWRGYPPPAATTSEEQSTRDYNLSSSAVQDTDDYMRNLSSAVGDLKLATLFAAPTYPSMAGGIREVAEGYKPCAAMVATQCIFAAMTLWVKAAFGGGMSPMVFVVYRQAVATLVLAPVAAMANRRRLKEMRLGMRSFSLVFVAALVGNGESKHVLPRTAPRIVDAGDDHDQLDTGDHLHHGSSCWRQERVNITEASTIAKIFGTAICVGGAVALAFFKGPKLLNDSLSNTSMLLPVSSEWLMGALLLICSSSCWSFWLILQACGQCDPPCGAAMGPICKSYMDPLTLSAWTCFLSTLQSAALAFFLLPDQSAWRIHSVFELSCYVFAGVFGSGVNFYLQSWCISARGPLYSAMFTPLCTVVTTALAAVVLREELHVGSLLGAVAIVAGLYVVLWGKAEDAKRGRPAPSMSKDPTMAAAAGSGRRLDVENTLAAPLLADSSSPRAPEEPN